MRGEVIQVRDVPAEDVAVLRERAAQRNMSLSGYLRDLIHRDTSQPTMDEALTRIAGRDSIEVSSAEIQEFIDLERR